MALKLHLVLPSCVRAAPNNVALWEGRTPATHAHAAPQAAAGEESGEAEAGVKALPLVIKADVQGSAEALRDAVANLSSEQVGVQAGGGKAGCACSGDG